MALLCCSHFNWLLAPQPRLNGESFRDLSLSQRIVILLPLAAAGEIAFLFPYNGWSELDGGKSITVITMTMEANSTGTSTILKPSTAPAYQEAP